MDTEALVAGIAASIGVVIYSFLGWRLSRRQVPDALRFASGQFAAFWVGLAAVSALGGLESLIATVALPSLTLVVTLLYLEILLLCIVLWCLVGFLVFVFTGRNHLRPLSILYGALYVVLLYFITASSPTGVTVSAGTVSLSYASTFSGPLVIALLLGLLLPEFIGAILYFTLVFRTKDRTVRYRVTLVSWSLIGWFGLGFLNVGALLGGSLIAQTFAHSIGVIAALVILLAYYPPTAVQRRLGVQSIDAVPLKTG